MKFTSLARASSSTAAVCLLVTALLPCQEPEPASLRFINATGAEEFLSVRINGELLQTRGYRSGEATGRLEIGAGPCLIDLSHPQLGRIVLPLAMQPGEARSVVALREPGKAQASPPQPPKLSSHVVAQPPADTAMRRRLQILQATPQPELEVHLAGHELRCRRLQVETRVIEHPQPLLKHAGMPLARLPFDEPGDATLILFADDDGRLRHLFFLDPAGATEQSDERP